MNRFKRVMCCLASVMSVPMLFAAEPTISLTATPRYPWNGLVDLAFTIEGDEGAKYDTMFSVQDVVGGTNLSMKTVYKSPGVKANAGLEKLVPGTYNWLWDAPADVGHDFVSENVVIDAKVGDAITYSVKFNANGGTGSMANETFESGVTKSLTGNAFTRAGYTFQGWAMTSTGAVVYSNRQSVTDLTTTAGGVVNLYAVWKAALYMVIDLSGGSSAKSYPISYLDAVPSGGWNSTYKTTKLVLRRVSAGSFKMGSPSGESGRYSEDEVQHTVTLSKSFYIGVFEVTQKQYALVKGSNPCASTTYGKGDSYPVHYVSYEHIRGSNNGAKWPTSAAVDSSSFMGLLRSRTGLSAFDLPTEAQWEYSCRAGTTGMFAGTGAIGTMGWYSDNASGKTHPVGGKTANGWGLYDMHGNVQEWTRDWFSHPTSASVTDPAPDNSKAEGCRVRRGGSWYDRANGCRSADRNHNSIADAWNSSPNHTSKALGFRVSITL